MARLIRHSATGPHKIEPQAKPIWVCRCGLSKNQPFCDGSHKRCADEDPDQIYVYDEHGTRTVNAPADGPDFSETSDD